MSLIPQHIANLKLYGGAALTEFFGVVDVELPKFEGVTETITGAGIAGEYESVTIGHLKAMAVKFKLRVATSDALKLGVGTAQVLEARAAAQSQESTTGGVTLSGWRVRVTGQIKSMSPGKLEPGKMMDAEVEVSCAAVHIYENRTQRVIAEPLNGVYIVDGVDLLAAERVLVS